MSSWDYVAAGRSACRARRFSWRRWPGECPRASSPVNAAVCRVKFRACSAFLAAGTLASSRSRGAILGDLCGLVGILAGTVLGNLTASCASEMPALIMAKRSRQEDSATSDAVSRRQFAPYETSIGRGRAVLSDSGAWRRGLSGIQRSSLRGRSLSGQTGRLLNWR